MQSIGSLKILSALSAVLALIAASLLLFTRVPQDEPAADVTPSTQVTDAVPPTTTRTAIDIPGAASRGATPKKTTVERRPR